MAASIPSRSRARNRRFWPWGRGDAQRPEDERDDYFLPETRGVGSHDDYYVDDEDFDEDDPPDAPRPRSRRWWWISRGIAAALLLFFIAIIWLAFTAPLSKSLEPIAPPRITLLASDGTPIARTGAIVDEPVEVGKLPPHVVEAFMAIEDRRFYDHWGVDPRGIARAMWTGRGGGSTITQQLAKFTFLSPERTLTRKAREAMIAFWLEAWLTKDEILERYLSNAYFGDNVYGLRAASLHYFYRQPEKLKPEQAAMLAGLVQAPSRYAPTRHWARAEARMRVVKAAMVDAGYITEAQARAMPTPRLDVRLKETLPTGTYFADWALPEARERSGAGYSAIKVRTTLDSRLQAAAKNAIARASIGGAQAALVAMRPNGEVVAMVGGRDYAKSPFNRATQAKRQPGSTFKTFVYLAALREGWEPDDTISNEAITQGSYRPKNARDRYSPTITLEDAFARSSNVATLRLFNEVGDAAVIKAARDLGIRSPLPKGDPSLALGTSTVTLLELTAAYAGLAGNSFPIRPRAFAAEEPGWFDWITDGKSSLSGSTHEEMSAMLRRAINAGTGRAATLAIANYGKTGTTQDNRDALFVGWAGDLIVGVWIGNDDNSPLGGISGGGAPALIWKDFMRAALGKVAAPPPRRPAPSPDPSGPVQPQDVPDLEDIPLGDGTNLRVRDGEAVFTTDIEGFPVDIRIGPDGIGIDAEEARVRAAERAAEARARIEERAAEAAEREAERIERRLEEARR